MDSIGLMISAKNEDYIKSLLDALNENGNCNLIGHNRKAVYYTHLTLPTIYS